MASLGEWPHDTSTPRAAKKSAPLPRRKKQRPYRAEKKKAAPLPRRKKTAPLPRRKNVPPPPLLFRCLGWHTGLWAGRGLAQGLVGQLRRG